MRVDVTCPDDSVLDYTSCPIGSALVAPIVLRVFRTHWVSCIAIPYKLQEGSQS
jgi:hypothetical protein